MSELVASNPPNISKPRWDQATFEGRAYHFFAITNPLNLFVTSSKLERCKKIVDDYRVGVYPKDLTVSQLWRAKNLYDSAYHPDSGEKMFILGRMSAQVPCNMMLTGGMLTFYSKFSHVVFGHWVNQTFNAVVNYTNRSGKNEISNNNLLISYVAATSSAVGTALFFNNYVVKKLKSPRLGIVVPFIAVAVANAINIPLMRKNEFEQGIPVYDGDGCELGLSRTAPIKAVASVVGSRIGMAAPIMFVGPVIVDLLKRILKRRALYKNWMGLPLQIGVCGLMLSISTPICCAFFEQRSSMKVTNLLLDKPLQEKFKTMANPPQLVYFNKGL